MKFRPFHDRVALRRVDSETKTSGGIIIPETAAEKPQEGESHSSWSRSARRRRQDPRHGLEKG
jgi:co-chaperonin GroES (HSP10)